MASRCMQCLQINQVKLVVRATQAQAGVWDGCETASGFANKEYSKGIWQNSIYASHYFWPDIFVQAKTASNMAIAAAGHLIRDNLLANTKMSARTYMKLLRERLAWLKRCPVMSAKKYSSKPAMMCYDMYASMNGHMDTWPPNYQKKDNLFRSFSGWKMIHDFMLFKSIKVRCNVEARIHPLGWSSWWQGLWTETQGLCFFFDVALKVIRDVCSPRDSDIWLYMCFVAFSCYDFWQWVEYFFVLLLWMQHEMVMPTSPCARKAL